MVDRDGPRCRSCGKRLLAGYLCDDCDGVSFASKSDVDDD